MLVVGCSFQVEGVQVFRFVRFVETGVGQIDTELLEGSLVAAGIGLAVDYAADMDMYIRCVEIDARTLETVPAREYHYH